MAQSSSFQGKDNPMISRKTGLMCIFVIVSICYSILFAKEVKVSGFVKTFSNNQPIDSAMVVIFETDLSMSSAPSSFDTTFSQTNGAFNMVITVSDTCKMLVYAAYKPGFLAKSATRMFLLQPVPNDLKLGEIKLKTIDDAKDTLQVKGKTVDSLTSEAIADALLVITSGLIGDITIDSVRSGTNGEFDTKIPFIPSSGLFNSMIYLASKDEYEPKQGMQDIPQNRVVDLGTVKMYKIGNPIKNPYQILYNAKPNQVKIYAINGKLLYTGSIDRATIKSAKFVTNQQVIVRYFKDNKLIGTLKNVLIH